jgi:sugar transferase (PEP-CTERM/EpsH1 system associated)
MSDPRPLVCHVVYRFDTGGLENGVVNLINHMDRAAYRHAIVALTEVGEFRKRIRRDDVEFVALNKSPGQTALIFPKIYRLFRQMKPAIVHTRNLAALEVAAPAWAAGVPVRVHGEHGRDVGDLDGSNKTYQWVRRAYRPFVNRYIALSKDLETYLIDRVGISPRAIAQIYNGVDAEKFHPAAGARPSIPGCPFQNPGQWLIGTVGRMQSVKDQTLLAQAFILALRQRPELAARLRLVMVGDGPLRETAGRLLAEAGVANLAWLPGERSDVPDVLRGFDCFVLPSLAEGISNTILEAMACGRPVVATRVGGNAELVVEGTTGCLIPAADPAAMAAALLAYADDPAAAAAAGRAGRAEIERRFSMDAMVQAYRGVYEQAMGRVRF